LAVAPSSKMRRRKDPAELRLAQARSEGLAGGLHGQLGDPLCFTYGRDLVGGLDDLGCAQHRARIAPFVPIEGAQHGVGLLVDPEACAGREGTR